MYGVSDRDYLVASWSGSLSGSTNLGWQSQARGIEQLVGNAVTVANSGVPILGFWDSAVCYQADLSAYPRAENFYGANAVQMCSSIDYASSEPNFIIALVDGGGGIDGRGAGSDNSGYSLNGGASWTSISSAPPNNGLAGSVAASTPTNIVFAPGQSDGSGHQPYYTTNFGTSTTWTGCTLPSDQTSWSDFVTQTNFGGRYVTADRGKSNTFYMVFPNETKGTSFYKSTDSGATWKKIGSFTGQSANNRAFIKTPYGQADDFWFAGSVLYHYYAGHLVKITNIQSVGCVGFGANPGGGYPSVFIVGYAGSTYPGTYGIYRSDNAATGPTPSWTRMGRWPTNSFDAVRDISGDPGIPKQCYVVFAGSGFAYYKAA